VAAFDSASPAQAYRSFRFYDPHYNQCDERKPARNLKLARSVARSANLFDARSLTTKRVRVEVLRIASGVQMRFNHSVRCLTGRLPILFCFALAIAIPIPAHAFRLHVPCTSSHDCPRGAFCRHQTSFRGQCITPPQTPFGITGRRQVEFPPQSDPPEHIFGSMAILRCSNLKPCPAGFVCAKYGSSSLEEALCVPYSEPCWSTADCSPGDMCDKEDDEFSLSGICRPRERSALGLFE
jgi:hypothetical protein